MRSLPDPIVPRAQASPSGEPVTVATIDLSALAHNVRQVRRCVAAGCQIIAIVKADAYGHGASAITRALIDSGVTRFGVARLAEGITLREAGITAPILVMGALFESEYAEAIAHGLTPVIYEAGQLDRIVASVRRGAAPYPVHLKIDTGMGRLGFSPDEAVSVLQSPVFASQLRLEGLMTHLADADSRDADYTGLQVERFRGVVERVEAAGLQVPIIHAANSAGILCHPSSHFTAVRPGIMLYGYDCARESNHGVELRPVLSLATRVAQIRTVARGESVSYNRTFTATRPSKIAVLPIGYADGYNRLLSNRGVVGIRERRAPVVGRVCMDMMMADVTDIPGVQQGDEAIVIGSQGEVTITAQHIADAIGTIPYEVLCAIGPRVRRVCR